MKILIVQDLDLDCAIDLTQAPGLSAYNRAERKMYHLSKELAGIVLPADTYGTHLKDGRTIDEKLEEENFKAAGEVLSEVWSNLVIDDHPVTCEYVSQKPPEYISGFTVSASYKSRHLIETQYMTVALKCEDVMCCAPPKTMVSKFFPGRRVPALIPIKHTINGPRALPLNPDVVKEELVFLDVFQRLAMESFLLPDEVKEKFKGTVPYDAYFPSIQDKVVARICITCGKYFNLKLSLIEHKQVCKKKRAKEDNGTRASKIKRFSSVVSAFNLSDEFFEGSDDDEDEPDLGVSVEEALEVTDVRPKISIPGLGGIETILNLREWLKSPYQLLNDV